MKTQDTELCYGIQMPVWEYTIRWSCGCQAHNVRTASIEPIPEVWHYHHPCAACDPTPPANVWD